MRPLHLSRDSSHANPMHLHCTWKGRGKIGEEYLIKKDCCDVVVQGRLECKIYSEVPAESPMWSPDDQKGCCHTPVISPSLAVRGVPVRCICGHAEQRLSHLICSSPGHNQDCNPVLALLFTVCVKLLEGSDHTSPQTS